MKRKKIFLIFFLSLTGMILLDSFFHPVLAQLKDSINLSGKEVIATPALGPLLIFITIIYIAMFIAGMINLSIFLVRKIKNKPVFTFNRPVKEIPLERKGSLQLIFSLIFLLFLTTTFPALFPEKPQLEPIYLILGLNLFLQAGSIFIVLRYINFSFFDLTIRKKELNFVFSVYTALIPLILFALIANVFLLEFFGIEIAKSPIEKITPLIDTNFSLFIFTLQATLIAPLAEEFVFRGVFYKLMRKKYSFLVSAIAISLFFTLLHRSPAGTMSLLILSLGTCYVYEKTQKLSSAFILHSLHNIITILFFFGTR